ncbi:MAG TPA: tetratricopeptide repeat protein [Acidobacteriota bacterium]|jgi:DNA-binding winged helix-turn-helix (wHTH) protein/TolB-like protein/Flp pilus assembly protein TadD
MSKPVQPVYEFGPFRLDASERLLLRDREPVPVTPKVFDTLLVLLEHNGRLVEKGELMQRLWPDTFVEEGALTRNISDLRKALDDGSNSQKYVETVPKRGYRFIATVREIGDDGSVLIIEKTTQARLVIEEGQEAGQGGITLAHPFQQKMIEGTRQTYLPARAGFRRIFLVLCLFLVGLAFALAWYWQFWQTRPPQQPAETRLTSLAVLPFKPLNSEGGDQILELGMADTLITRLSNLSHVIVRPTSTIRRYTSVQQDPIAAGRELGVDSVLEGSIQKLNDRIRVTVRLLRVGDGKPLWAYKCDEKYEDLFQVQDSVSEQVATALMPSLTGQEKRLVSKRHTENLAAYQLYLNGRYFWNKRTAEGFQKALVYFSQAIEKDPNYALAYVGLADSYTMLADYDWLSPKDASPKAKKAVMKALALDEALAEAHTSLADIRRFYDWDWAGAEREYKRAIELNPNYPTAHQWYAEFLSAMGRHDEAMREIKHAEELDPLSLVVKSAAGWILFWARRYDQAIEACRKVIEMDPNYGEIYSQLRRVYEQKGMYAEALDADGKLRAFREKRVPRVAESGNGDAISNAKAYWQKMLELTKNDLKSNQEAAQMRMAEIFTQLGDKDQAFAWLDKVYESHHFWLPFLKVHPHLDPLHSDPRFEALLRRVGLG